jgi:hypothetical protein
MDIFVYWDYVFYLVIISIILAVITKFLSFKFKIIQNNLRYFYIVFGGIAIYIVLDLFAVFYDRNNMYDRISCMYTTFYIISLIFACQLYFITAYIYKKHHILQNITSLFGSILFLTILYETIENPLWSFLHNYENQINWGEALPELVLFIIISMLAVLNIINLALFVVNKWRVKK